MPSLTTFLTYDHQAEAAAAFYVSVFDGKVVSTMGAPGAVMAVTFELLGQRIIALNGGPTFSFSEGFSLFVGCDTQAEVDTYWQALTADGGKEGRCGWLVDKFGVSWQIVPNVLGRFLGDSDRDKAGRAMSAMLQMNKLDIAGLERAHRGA